MTNATKPVKESGGLVLYRRSAAGALEILLGHPGGPFWASKDEGAWSIPKGELGSGEDGLVAARRETFEETGIQAKGPFVSLGSITQKSGKVVHAWAAPLPGELAPHRSNEIEIEWPPRSGLRILIPEIDRVALFDVVTARSKVNPAQIKLIDRLVHELAAH